MSKKFNYHVLLMGLPSNRSGGIGLVKIIGSLSLDCCSRGLCFLFLCFVRIVHALYGVDVFFLQTIDGHPHNNTYTLWIFEQISTATKCFRFAIDRSIDWWNNLQSIKFSTSISVQSNIYFVFVFVFQEIKTKRSAVNSTQELTEKNICVLGLDCILAYIYFLFALCLSIFCYYNSY